MVFRKTALIGNSLAALEVYCTSPPTQDQLIAV